MLKAGTMRLAKNKDYLYYVYMYQVKGKTRLDITLNNGTYNSLYTTDCEASEIRDSRTAFYGDLDLINTVREIMHRAQTNPIPEKRDVSLDSGVFTMVIQKQSDNLNYRSTSKNGRLVEEIFETDLGALVFTSFSEKNDDTIRPLNYNGYTDVITKDVQVVTVTPDKDFYTEAELLRLHPNVRHVLAPENDYVVVESYEQGVERLNTWINSKERLKSVDIESRDKLWYPTSNNRITGVILGLGEQWSTYFPFRQDVFDYNLPLEFLRTVFDAINNQPKYPEVIILSHNGKFEIEGFYQEFREIMRLDVDTFLLAKLVDPDKMAPHDLKSLTQKYEGKEYLELKDIFLKKVQFNVLPIGIVKLYACPDGTSPAKIYKALMKELPEDEQFMLGLECQLPPIKAINEFYGIRLDQQRLATLIETEEQDCKKLENIFRTMHKKSSSVNINSNDVMINILYNELNCKVQIYTDKGEPSCSKAAIAAIVREGYKDVPKREKPIPDILSENGKILISSAELNGNRYPSLIVYQKYKKHAKELSALKRLRDHSVDGYFMFYINQSGADTNRQTSDAQQFSDTMKSCALADSPYHQLVSCDYKQVELRILAGLAGQKDLMELEADMGVDIHRAIASLITGKPMYMISEEDRSAYKSVNFGVVYMMSKYGLAIRDFGPSYTTEQLMLEEQKITDFFNALPKIKAFLEKNKRQILEKGYIKTLFNYYRYFKRIKDPSLESSKKSSLLRSGNNTPVQGTGAQILKISETLVQQYIKKKGWDKEKNYDGRMLPMARLILPIHDEHLFSYDKSIPKEEICQMFLECMQIDIKGLPPLYSAPAFVDNWLQAHDPQYEVDLELRDEIVARYKKGQLTFNDEDKDDYLRVLNTFRDEQIARYLDGLIAKYKTVDEVAAHVKDDNLTHTIISTVPKDIRKPLSHIERIREGVRIYMEKHNGEYHFEIDSEVKDDENDSWNETYEYYDAEGNLVVEDNTDETVGADRFTRDDGDILDVVTSSRTRVVYTMADCFVDLTGLTDEVAVEVNKLMKSQRAVDGAYTVKYIKGYKHFESDIKINYNASLERLIKEVCNER